MTQECSKTKVFISDAMEYDALSEKIMRLKKARVIEVDPSTIFKLEKQIEEAEQQREIIAGKIRNVL